ncbi:MAG TPA: efflux RND transporter periplasmic adaptor subunit [Candidatus Krumholzibacteria bacterium]|nr:efflux RND transporter periplasmic adaptor subunit [Candidatus Krumholzibacteria bacterium]
MTRARLTMLMLALSLITPTARAAGTGAPPVVVARAVEVSFPLTVQALGNARANESVEIRPRISQTVTAIRFDEGQDVAAGDVLVELENAEALAAVAEAKAALADAESKFQRGQELFRLELASAAELEQLEARRDADRAGLAAADARLAETVVRAPFAGRTGLRRVSLGSLVGPTTVITTLDDTDPVKVDFDVPETAIARVAVGLPVEARSAAWPDTVFHGAVMSIDTRIDRVSRTLTVRALVPNPRGLLRPGMFLTVELLRRDVTALVVPEEALVPEQSRQFVLVVGDDGTVERREVTLGRRRPGQVEIVRGLAAGERVVVEGTQKARPGQPVEVVGEAEVRP